MHIPNFAFDVIQAPPSPNLLPHVVTGEWCKSRTMILTSRLVRDFECSLSAAAYGKKKKKKSKDRENKKCQ